MTKPATLDDLKEIMEEQTELLRYWNDTKANQALVTFQISGTSSITLCVPNPTRKGVIIVNTDANDLYLRYGVGATTSSGGWTIKIGQNTTWEMPAPIYTGQIDGVWSVDGAGVAEITEW